MKNKELDETKLEKVSGGKEEPRSVFPAVVGQGVKNSIRESKLPKQGIEDFVLESFKVVDFPSE